MALAVASTSVPAGSLEIGVVLGARAEAEEAGLRHQRAGNEDPRAERRGDAHVAGDMIHRSRDREAERTDREGVAHGRRRAP